jgi:hypothetical protein
MFRYDKKTRIFWFFYVDPLVIKKLNIYIIIFANYFIQYYSIGVIIFGSVRFLSKKVTKPIFFKKKNRTRTETGSNQPVSVRFGFLGQKPYKSVWLGFSGLARFWLGFGSVLSGFGSVFRFVLVFFLVFFCFGSVFCL